MYKSTRGLKLDFIMVYDKNENLITMFNTYKECAEYFNTTLETIYTTIHRRGKRKYKGEWLSLEASYKVERNN